MAKDVKPQNKSGDFIPMPPIGWPVQFYDKGLKKTCLPGVVAQHNTDPGQIVVRYSQGTVTRQTMNATWHPLTEGKPPTPTVMEYGTWDYLPGQETPECHYDFHVKRIGDMERAVEIRKQNDEAMKKAYQESLKEQPNIAAARVQQAAAMVAAAQQGV